MAPAAGPLSAHEWPIFEALEPVVEEARAHGLECFWFLHKEPGLRLRFGGEHLPRGLCEAVDGALSRLAGTGLVGAWFRSVYEPETHFLGGPGCLDLVHRHFDRDSAAAIRWMRAVASGSARCTNTVMALAATVDLVERCVGAREEVWDVWRNVSRLYGAPAEPADIPAVGLTQVGSMNSPVMAEMAERYVVANGAFAGGLAQLWRSGSLTVGRRALLPTIAAYHWNRYALKAETIARLAQAMATHYDPHHGLIGSAPDAQAAR